MRATLLAGLGSVAVLCLSAASATLFGWQVFGEWVGDFARANILLPAIRKQLLGSTMWVAAAVAGVSLGYLRLAGERGVQKLNRFARLVAPSMLIGLVPSVLARDVWDPLNAAILIAVFTLLFERLLRFSVGAFDEICGSPLWVRSSSPWLRRSSTAAAFAGAIFYGGYMSRYTLFAHRRFQTYNFDLGQYDNVFWNALHGHPLRCTPLGAMENWSSLSSHADFGVYVLLPLYALRPNAETLLILQAFILGLGAIPLYLFARRHIPPTYAGVLAFCYLLYPPLHGSNFYDFHFQPIAATFVLFTIWLVDSRRWIWLALSFVAAASCREDISVGLTMLGIYLVITRYRPAAGFLMAVAGTVYFVLIRFYIMPRFGQGWFSDIYKDLYPQPGGPNSFSGVIQTLMTNPVYVFRTLLTTDKLRYFLQIMVPVAFLPLRRGYLLPAIAPGALFTLLTTAYGPTTDIGFQYSGHFTPYIFAASALALAAYRADPDATTKMRAGLGGLAMGTLLCTTYWGAFPPGGVVKGGFNYVNFARPTPLQEQKARDLAELAAMIPPDAKFGVSEEELPHVSGRLHVMSMRGGAGSAEYLIYGIGSSGSNVGSEVLASGEFVELARRPSVQLLVRKK